MQLKADIHAGGVECIEDRSPAPRQLAKASSTRPAGRCGQGYQYGHASAPEKLAVALSPRRCEAMPRISAVVTGPGRTRFGITPHVLGGEAIKQGVISRMHGDELALQMR